MTGNRAFLRKELLEIARTWRIWVVPGLIVFFALTSPVIALLAPTLVRSLAGSQPGVIIELPDPIPADAYRQFLKNMNQIALVAIVISCAGLISGERRSGTIQLVLTKPMSRAGFVLSKITAQCLLVGAATIVGAGLCALMTIVCFGSALPAGFFGATALWLVQAALLITLMTFLSTVLPTTGAAAGAGLAALLAAMLLGFLPGSVHTFVGLPDASSALIAAEPVELAWPVVTAVVAGFVLSSAAVMTFRRQEIG